MSRPRPRISRKWLLRKYLRFFLFLYLTAIPKADILSSMKVKQAVRSAVQHPVILRHRLRSCVAKLSVGPIVTLVIDSDASRPNSVVMRCTANLGHLTSNHRVVIGPARIDLTDPDGAGERTVEILRGHFARTLSEDL